MSDYDDDAAAKRYEDAENLRPVGRGVRPKRSARTLGKHVPIRFPEALTVEIKRLADRDGMTVSTWIRNVVTREVERRRPRPTTVGRSEGIEFQREGVNYPITKAVGPELPLVAAE